MMIIHNWYTLDSSAPVATPVAGINANNPNSIANLNEYKFAFKLPIVPYKYIDKKDFYYGLLHTKQGQPISLYTTETHYIIYYKKISEFVIEQNMYKYLKLVTPKYMHESYMKIDYNYLKQYLSSQFSKYVLFNGLYEIIPNVEASAVKDSHYKFKETDLNSYVDIDAKNNIIEVTIWFRYVYPIIDTAKIDFKSGENIWKKLLVHNTNNFVHKHLHADFNKQPLSYPQLIVKMTELVSPTVYIDKKKNIIDNAIITTMSGDENMPYAYATWNKDSYKTTKKAKIVYNTTYSKQVYTPEYFERSQNGIKINGKFHPVDTYAVPADQIPVATNNVAHYPDTKNSTQATQSGIKVFNKDSFRNNYPGTTKNATDNTVTQNNNSNLPIGKIMGFHNANALTYMKKFDPIQAFDLIDATTGEVTHIAVPTLIYHKFTFLKSIQYPPDLAFDMPTGIFNGLVNVASDASYVINESSKQLLANHEFYTEVQAFPVSENHDPAYYAYATKDPKKVKDIYKSVINQYNQQISKLQNPLLNNALMNSIPNANVLGALNNALNPATPISNITSNNPPNANVLGALNQTIQAEQPNILTLFNEAGQYLNNLYYNLLMSTGLATGDLSAIGILNNLLQRIGINPMQINLQPDASLDKMLSIINNITPKSDLNILTYLLENQVYKKYV